MAPVVAVFLLAGIYWKNAEKTTGAAGSTTALHIPVGFPRPVIPADNQPTPKRIDLGRQLFYDPVLSRDSTISCASCHRQEYAFADNVPLSPGVDGRKGFRNAPTLANVAWHGRLNKDGGVVKLDMQAVVPIEDKDEMDLPLPEAAKRLRKNPQYVELFLNAYDRPPDPFTITRALASFVRTLISANSRYDQYFFQNNKDALTPGEKRGMALFFSQKTNCSTCHSGFNFTNNAYENNGLQREYPNDEGRKRVTLRPEDEGKFRVPTLRNVELTAPYMHDGRLTTLSQVLEHYNSGGSNHPNKNPAIRPLSLTETEKSDLINFLKTLTDSTFINNRNFKKP